MVADMQEISEFWTGIIRDEDQKTADRIKASELLLKLSGVLEDRTEENTVRIVLEGEAREMAE